VPERPSEQEHPVAPLELLLDLVFVFGFTQVTTVLADDPTWRGLARGLLILAALWWSWASYAWLTNTLDADDQAVWGTMFVAMAAMFVTALAVPDAFGRHGVVFGVAFLIVSVMHLALYAIAARGDRDLLAAILRVAPASIAGASLILAAGFVHGWARPLLWLVALVIGFVAPVMSGVGGWRMHPRHFVERHGLIVIIAIGEALIAIGLGARATRLGAGEIVAALLGFLVAASFWLAYFDFFPIRARQMLMDRSGAERVALARDLYTYFHLPMVGGIVLFAFAMKDTLAHVGTELGTIQAVALCGGPALYLLSFVALRIRVTGSPGGGRLTAAIACALLIPVAVVVPAIVSLALVAAVWVGLHTYEIVWWRDARLRTRALGSAAGAAGR
jgi:low temperature requirement protein LtrA